MAVYQKHWENYLQYRKQFSSNEKLELKLMRKLYLTNISIRKNNERWPTLKAFKFNTDLHLSLNKKLFFQNTVKGNIYKAHLFIWKWSNAFTSKYKVVRLRSSTAPAHLDLSIKDGASSRDWAYGLKSISE